MNQAQAYDLKADQIIYIVKKSYPYGVKESFVFKHRLYPIKIVKVTLRSITVKPYQILLNKEKWGKVDLQDFGVSKWDAWHIAQKTEEVNLKDLKEVIRRMKLMIEDIKVEKKKYKKGK